MKERIKKTFMMLPLTLPIVFIICFLGYFTPQFNVRLYTDNIVGEGLGTVYLAQKVPFAYNYKAYFYFGSQLKTVDMKGFHYDVKQLSLEFSDVSEADLLSFDVSSFGIPLGHYDFSHIPSGDYGYASITQSENGTGVHITFKNPNQTNYFELECNFLSIWFWAIYWFIFLLIVLLVAFGTSFIIDQYPVIQMPLLHLSGIAAVMIAGCWFCGSLPFVNYAKFLLTWLILSSISLLINSLTLPCLGTSLVMAFITVWYAINHYVVMYRGKPIMPADLKAIGTAKEVLGSYILSPSPKMIIGILAIIIYIAFIILQWKSAFTGKKELFIRKNLVMRGVGFFVSIALLIISVVNPIYKNIDSFQWDNMILNSFHKDGMVLTFMKNLESAGLTKPDGYSRQAVNAYLSDYQTVVDEPKEDKIRPTNIIMVMNEAFSDLRVVGLDKSVDVMPFIDSLDQNVSEGSLYVSVYGGGTCNTEFEALTGNTLAFLKPGAYPYTESITAPMFSIASYLHNLDYQTDAFHANEADNWNRNRVYPNLGFDLFFSINDYKKYVDISKLHGFPTDSTDYQLMKTIDELNKDTPRFLFNVTMQNHGGYERWIDVEEAESVKGIGYTDQIRVYLSLVKVSDDSVKQLVETYQNSDEPTMIIFFGDHQPGFTTGAQDQLYPNSDTINKYSSKFFIWTNYATETAHDTVISANYLPWLILKRGNFEMPPYIRMLEELHNSYPVISAQGVLDAVGNLYGSVADLAEDPLIQKYQYIQYANMMGELDDAWFVVDSAKK